MNWEKLGNIHSPRPYLYGSLDEMEEGNDNASAFMHLNINANK